MHNLKQKLSVPFQYSVHFTRDLFAPANLLLRKVVRDGHRGPAHILFVVDRGACTGREDLPDRMARYCAFHSEALILTSPPLVVPGGERVKNSASYVYSIQKAIHDNGLCRHSFIVAVGGGAVLDMAGFAAATAHRGVRLVRVPTTVLAQNDSGVGVKNSINAFGKKNFLGTFVPPYSVLISSLPS